MDPYESEGKVDGQNENNNSSNIRSPDKFKESFKKYKSCKNIKLFKSFEEIFEPERAGEFLINKLATRKYFNVPGCNGSSGDRICSDVNDDIIGVNPNPVRKSNGVQENCQQLFGLTCPSTWEIYELHFPEGLVFIKNPFTPEGQRYWISKCLSDYPKEPHVTNMENLRRRQPEAKKDPILSADTNRDQFYKELRWITFGYHHDWDTKVYSEDNHCEFPWDLADLTKYFSLVLGYDGFNAEAAIVNYYHLDSTLSGHVDKSEKNQFAPLFSLSFGQKALFLIGADTKDKTPLAVYLKSGDIVVMAGPSRLSYHGVPKILSCSNQPWEISDSSKCNQSVVDDEIDPGKAPKKMKLDDKTISIQNSNLCDFVKRSRFSKVNPEVQKVLQNWTDFHSSYISKSRINLNVRQVLFPGQKSLSDDS